MLKSSSLCLHSSNLGTFWLKIEQFWPFEEISIFSNSGHLEWRAGLSDTILKGTHPGTIPVRFGLIWFSSFRGEDLNVIFYQNIRGRRNRWPVASIFTVGPVKLNKDRPAGPVDILGPLGPATFVSSVSINID